MANSAIAARGRLGRDLAWCIGLLAALLLWDLSGVYLPLMWRWGGIDGFALRDTWVTTVLLHQGGRALGWVVVALLVLQLWPPLPFARALPLRERAWWLATTALCPLLIPLLKHLSLTS